MLEILIPLAIFVLFFVAESINKLSEIQFTVFAIFSVVLIWLFKYNSGEFYLYFVGVILGVVIEIGMRTLGYQQIWPKAHLFGVPYWLPLIWGVGFVVIARIGIFLRTI
ncbi:MAG: hypothetical protein UW46_C0001G0126 [Candidatus Yanofskybacteria bacterium GW2011_GWF1_44_227]|uniref:Uncharacterized protein n=1 Tax=Candidatus Yanofskybacteria bacterium GW2011_GWE2_40_11 TaxID=1619033 RepID=A0A0G0TTE3_9BACT|nr:MAG: hypothetical protein UT69_C0013G0055 [Candidatus Yanofskybacteria bacterium GW2011_GWE1_40_10]KKR41152.1 MAG: hypothetical protein UT75_C0001G0056 [Candidatus Yanofskybacteria bacterium GW2011_GWE2_40_11]KKT15851.1 MAG: hypothetical protein UV97_C0001G0024 [Candidatus Yanofskybacteria bacterium GW2011_GWF2_43_596]KKT53636.1 MAG: hypothetical protein UW46_C0001G0126 [Candidatus Yanofskybacteria bacterium GW2011_GWF1_44_227]OGN36239.1 MAG: hypothetical protein A2241_00645 [Candidatus Yano